MNGSIFFISEIQKNDLPGIFFQNNAFLITFSSSIFTLFGVFFWRKKSAVGFLNSFFEQKMSMKSKKINPNITLKLEHNTKSISAKELFGMKQNHNGCVRAHFQRVDLFVGKNIRRRKKTLEKCVRLFKTWRTAFVKTMNLQ